MKKKLSLTVMLLAILLIVAGSVATSRAYYLDTPHNESNGIMCYTCHTAAWYTYTPSGSVDDTLFNQVCLRCHDKVPSDLTRQGPSMILHASSTTSGSYGVWSTGCSQCHDPHFQGQLDWESDANLWLAWATFDNPGGVSRVFNASDPLGGGYGTTSIAFDSLAGRPGWTDTTTWKAKGGRVDAGRATDNSRGLVLVPNKATPTDNYEIVAVNGAVIKVKGNMPSTPDNQLFGVIYGQSLRARIWPNGATTSADYRDVKFFQPATLTGTSGGSVDLSPTAVKPLGICQACHTQTMHWKKDGSGSGHENSASGSDCLSCHGHLEGFPRPPVVNSAPTANAGPDQQIQLPASATLNGSGSSDPEGNQLTYQWQIVAGPAGSNATLNNPTTVNPTFVTDIPGVYTVELVVHDGLVNSLSAQISITVIPEAGGGHAPPTLTVGLTPKNILPGQTASLSWVTSEADTVIIDNGIGSVEPAGSRAVSPLVSTTYTLIASGPGGTIEVPVTIGVVKQQQINALDVADNYFGYRVAIDGEYAVIGADDDDEKAPGAGAAYVFKKGVAGWEQQSKLLASDGTSYDNFGQSVAIDGEYIIVGASYDDDKGRYTGSAYIFKLEGDAWIEQTKLTASDAFYDGEFGDAVAIDRDYAIVGAYYADDEIGAAYVFKREGEFWIEQGKLSPGDGEMYDYFGSTVAINGDLVVVGSPEDDDYTGGVYAFRRYGVTWVETAKIRGSDTAIDDEFGSSVGIYGETMVVGAPYNSSAVHYAGAAYIFKFDGSAWVEENKLSLSAAGEYDKFGKSVAIHNDYVVVGTGGGNSAHLYHYENGAWSASLEIADPPGESSFGNPVALSERDFIVGSGGDGRAYLYDIPDVFVSISAEPVQAPTGNAVLSWDSVNADSCTIEPGIGSVASLGSVPVLITGTTTYTLNCEGPLGFDSEAVTVHLGNAPPVATLAALPKYIALGGSSTLTWSIDKAETCVVEPGGIDCTINGSLLVAPAATTTYVLTVGNIDGVETVANATVAVSEPVYTAGNYSGDVDIDGQWAVKDNQGPTVSVYRRGATDWAEFSTFSAVDVPDDPTFGAAVALSGERLAIGAPGQEAVYIFQWNGTDWHQEAKVAAPGGTPEDEFGAGVDIDGDYLVVRSDFNDLVHVFHRIETGWQFQAELAGGLFSSSCFGGDIAISGSYIVVGDDYANSAFVFSRVGETWFKTAILRPDCLDTSAFGVSVDIDGDTVIIGDDQTSCVKDWLGAAYVFRRNGDSWHQEATLLPAVINYDLYFGEDVSISGDYAVVSAQDYPAALFKRNGAAWEETAWNFGYNLSDLSMQDHLVITSGELAMNIYERPETMAELSAHPVYAPDGNFTLAWSSVNADFCRIDPGIGEVEVSGTVPVTIENDTTYVLNCEGIFGATFDLVKVHHAFPPPGIIASADPELVYLGETAILAWASQNAEQIIVDNGVGAAQVNGSVEVIPVATTTYTVTANGPGGESRASATVEVIDPMASLTAPSPYFIPGLYGSYVRLDWSTLDLETCLITSQTSASSFDCSGVDNGYVYLITKGDTLYKLSGSDQLGKIFSDTALVKAVTVQLSVTDSVIGQGDSTALTWKTTNLDSCVIMPGNYDCSGSATGTIFLVPNQTTTYMLSGSGGGLTVNASQGVEVLPQLSASFAASPLYFEKDGTATIPINLTWQTTSASQVYLTSMGFPYFGDRISVAPSGSMTVDVNDSTFFILTARDGASGSTVTRSQFVKAIKAGMSGVGIIFPDDGASINGNQTLVHGLVDSTLLDPRVTVNGQPAQISGATFFINGLLLDEGENFIEVIATESDGTTHSDSIAVATMKNITSFDLSITPDYGMAPHTATLKATVDRLPLGVYLFSEIVYSTTGAGLVSITSINRLEHELSFSLPGLYTVRYILSYSSGAQDFRDVMVKVEDLADLDAQLKAKWEGMKSALAIQDIEGGLMYFLESSKDNYRGALNSISSHLPVMFSDVQDIQIVYVWDDRVKYRVNRVHDIDGTLVTTTYYIYFVRNLSGVWEIEQF